MAETSESEIAPQTNGIPDNELEEDDKTKMRPADIDADMREMERRKRVEMIMSSRLFREELERIIESQMKEGGGPAGLLQQIQDMVGGRVQPGHMFRNANCVVPINDIRGVESMGYAKGEKILRCKLAAVYRLMDLYGWTQGIHNHITARLNQDDEHFLVNAYGMLYHEVTASSLVKVDMQANIVESGTTNFGVNVPGFHLHAAVHAARPDIKCVIHIHTPSVLAVSSLKCGLLPLCQESAVIGEVSQHPYIGTVSEPEEKDKIARNLGPINKVMFLTNHGAVCCGETIEEAFFNVYNTVLACETQVKLMPLGVDNLQLLPDETRKQIYDAARRAPEGINISNPVQLPASLEKKEKRWRIGGLEFEALMRMLDNAGFRTGYIYRTPLVKGEPPRPRNDVEVPPAVSSLGYLLEEEEMYKQGNWKKFVDGRSRNDRTRWLNSPNVYQKVEILETGTPDPKKITKWVEANAEEWVAEGSPTHSSTPVKIESALQFVPKNTNPKEFKKLQKQIKENRRADKITSGPQSHILEGVSWEEAKKLQDANISMTGDQVILVGAASKGIIQREYQHNATVYKTPYAKNPFEAVSDQELEDYKKGVIRKQRGESYEEDQSESEALSSSAALPPSGIKSPPSETEDESRTADIIDSVEPRVLRIETKRAPVPSQAEIVLSDVDDLPPPHVERSKSERHPPAKVADNKNARSSSLERPKSNNKDEATSNCLTEEDFTTEGVGLIRCKVCFKSLPGLSRPFRVQLGQDSNNIPLPIVTKFNKSTQTRLIIYFNDDEDDNKIVSDVVDRSSVSNPENCRINPIDVYSPLRRSLIVELEAKLKDLSIKLPNKNDTGIDGNNNSSEPEHLNDKNCPINGAGAANSSFVEIETVSSCSFFTQQNKNSNSTSSCDFSTDEEVNTETFQSFEVTPTDNKAVNSPDSLQSFTGTEFQDKEESLSVEIRNVVELPLGGSSEFKLHASARIQCDSNSKSDPDVAKGSSEGEFTDLDTCSDLTVSNEIFTTVSGNASDTAVGTAEGISSEDSVGNEDERGNEITRIEPVSEPKNVNLLNEETENRIQEQPPIPTYLPFCFKKDCLVRTKRGVQSFFATPVKTNRPLLSTFEYLLNIVDEIIDESVYRYLKKKGRVPLWIKVDNLNGFNVLDKIGRSDENRTVNIESTSPSSDSTSSGIDIKHFWFHDSEIPAPTTPVELIHDSGYEADNDKTVFRNSTKLYSVFSIDCPTSDSERTYTTVEEEGRKYPTAECRGKSLYVLNKKSYKNRRNLPYRRRAVRPKKLFANVDQNLNRSEKLARFLITTESEAFDRAHRSESVSPENLNWINSSGPNRWSLSSSSSSLEEFLIMEEMCKSSTEDELLGVTNLTTLFQKFSDAESISLPSPSESRLEDKDVQPNHSTAEIRESNNFVNDYVHDDPLENFQVPDSNLEIGQCSTPCSLNDNGQRKCLFCRREVNFIISEGVKINQGCFCEDPSSNKGSGIGDDCIVNESASNLNQIDNLSCQTDSCTSEDNFAPNEDLNELFTCENIIEESDHNDLTDDQEGRTSFICDGNSFNSLYTIEEVTSECCSITDASLEF